MKTAGPETVGKPKRAKRKAGNLTRVLHGLEAGDEITLEEFHDLENAGKVRGFRVARARSKYGNRTAVSHDGTTFDSKAERDRYEVLRLLQAAGQISELQCQPRYKLLAAFRDGRGRHHRAVFYVGDFAYVPVLRGHDLAPVTVVEEVKGFRTPVYRLKRKMFLAKYPDADFREVEV